jgi:hypothetical protein
VVFLEDPSPHEIVNAHIMPRAYQPDFIAASYAEEIAYLGTALYPVTLKNSGAMPDAITVSLSQDVLPGGVDPTEWEAAYREIGGSWGTDPSVYVLGPGEEVDLEVRLVDHIGTVAGMAITSLAAASAGNPEVTELVSFATFVEQASILLVDDDGGDVLESYFEYALSANGLTAMLWTTDIRGRPGEAELSSFWAVLWTTGASDCTQLSSHDEANMASYLDQGGNLYLSSNAFLQSHESPTTFIADYLHITSWTQDTGGFMLEGVDGDPVSDGMMLGMTGLPIPWQYTDTFAVDGGTVIFTTAAQLAGLRAEGSVHRLVFTSFPFENVEMVGPDPDNSPTLLSRILAWFQGSADVDETEGPAFARATLDQNVPNPFNPTTTLSFVVPGGAERARLAVYTVSGRLVATLHDGPLAPGRHSAAWDGTGNDGSSLPSGVYFARLSTVGEEVLRRMTLLK